MSFHPYIKQVFSRHVLALAAVICCGGCATPKPLPTVENRPIIPDAFWRGDEVQGSPRIVINLSEQRLRYFKGQELVGQTPISTGTRSHPTPTGSFRITQKDLYHRSSWYGDYVDQNGTVVKGDIDVRRSSRPPGTRYLGASMKYFMRVRGPVGMHEGYLPGYPASHGCIRLPTEMAKILFRVTPSGTPVQIVGNAAQAGPQPVLPIGYGVVKGLPTSTSEEATPVTSKAETQATAIPQEASAGAPREEIRPAKPVRRSERNRLLKKSVPPRGVTQYLE